MTKVAFFGASVTVQKDGYVTVFENLTKDMDITVFRHGYGGMRLDDAGISFIDEALKDKPNYLFLDWFSPSALCNENRLNKCLDLIVRKCFIQSIVPVFLLFDRNPFSEMREIMYTNVIKYADKYKINCINLYKNENATGLLKDEVHTTIIGSEFYGKRIYEVYSTLGKQPIIYEIPEKNELFDIKYKDVDIIVNSNISISGSFQLIGIYQDVGYFSGLIEKIEDGKKSNSKTWDIHCHYIRKNFNISTVKYCSNLIVNVLQDNFDTSACRRIYDFTDKKRYLRIYKIFYIGVIDSLIVNDNNIEL